MSKNLLAATKRAAAAQDNSPSLPPPVSSTERQFQDLSISSGHGLPPSVPPRTYVGQPPAQGGYLNSPRSFPGPPVSLTAPANPPIPPKPPRGSSGSQRGHDLKRRKSRVTQPHFTTDPLFLMRIYIPNLAGRNMRLI